MNCNQLFSGFRNLEIIEGWEYFDTSNVTNMSSMFENYSSSAILDLSHFDTSKSKRYEFYVF